jgi:hypothetical protein
MIESTMHLKGNPNENDFFLGMILMDKTEESKWTSMWHLMQNGHIRSIMITLIIMRQSNGFWISWNRFMYMIIMQFS